MPVLIKGSRGRNPVVLPSLPMRYGTLSYGRTEFHIALLAPVSAAEFAPVLLIGSVVVLVGVLAVRVASRIGFPSLLIYLGLGFALGESGLGIQFESAERTQILGLTALAIILAEGA